MEKLFNDKETFQKERPTKITKEQEDKYIREFAEQTIREYPSCIYHTDIETIIEDLRKIQSYDNGYEACKRLEEGYGSYNIDAMFVEHMDCFNSGKDDIHKKNIEDWVKANDIKPNLERGQKLMVDKTISHTLKQGLIVYVTGISKEQAYYTISENQNNNGGFVVDYEVVEKKCSKIN